MGESVKVGKRIGANNDYMPFTTAIGHRTNSVGRSFRTLAILGPIKICGPEMFIYSGVVRCK